MILTLIIGKNSNLSKNISFILDNYRLISSREILKEPDVLSQYRAKSINIIFNNFQPATQLNDIKNSQEYIKNSILITSIVLDYFDNTNINKIIYTSSSSVYGNNILCKESDRLNPMNLHSSLKVANEKLIEKYCLDKNIDYTITRIFNMYGGDDNFSIISKIIHSYLNKKEICIVNNGNAIRDFVHVEDVSFIYLKLLNLKNIKILNIGTGEGNSIKNILDYLSNHSIVLQTKNITRDELKMSTSNNELLLNTIKNKSLIRVEDYLAKEFKL